MNLAQLLMQGAGAGGTDEAGQRLRQNARPLLRALAAEYGLMGCDEVPHRLEESPATFYRDVAEGSSVELDVEQELGKVSMRGHVVNVGDAELILDWVPYTGDAWRGRYRLAAGAALDLSSFIVRRVRLECPVGNGAGRVQTLHQ